MTKSRYLVIESDFWSSHFYCFIISVINRMTQKMTISILKQKNNERNGLKSVAIGQKVC